MIHLISIMHKHKQQLDHLKMLNKYNLFKFIHLFKFILYSIPLLLFKSFLLIENEKFKNDYTYLSWLARCYIRNGRPRLAWELYLKLEHSNESFSLLQLIANDCYKMGHFYYAARAFDILERMDPNPEYWEGKRGACAGAFQLIVAGHEPR